MDSPQRIETARLLLRKPDSADAEAIFTGWASDAEVTRYLAWPTHRIIDDTFAFLRFALAEWNEKGCGPYARGRIHTLCADMSAADGRDSLATAVRERFGALDILINNVGTNIRRKLVEYSDEEVGILPR